MPYERELESAIFLTPDTDKAIVVTGINLTIVKVKATDRLIRFVLLESLGSI